MGHTKKNSGLYLVSFDKTNEIFQTNGSKYE